MATMKKFAEFSHKARLRFSAFPVQALLVFAALQFPATGYCNSTTGWIENLFASKGKTMKDVAVTVIELPEKFDINVRALDFSADGKLLAVDSADETINIWDWQNGRIIHALEKPQGAEDGLTTEPIRFSPDGRLLAACHGTGVGGVVARIWDTSTWKIVHDIVDSNSGGGCNAIGFTPDGKSLIRILDRLPNVLGDTLVIYDIQTWQPVWGMRTVPFYTYALAISPNGKFIALGGEVRNPRQWPYNTPIPTFGNPPLPDTTLIAIVDIADRAIVHTMQSTGVMDRKSRLAWSPDGAYLTGVGGEGLQIFDVRFGQPLIDVKPRLGTANTSLRYTPDGKYLIEGTMNSKKTGWGKIWDGQHRELLQEISANVGSIAVSRDGHYLATGVDGKTIVWQLK